MQGDDLPGLLIPGNRLDQRRVNRTPLFGEAIHQRCLAQEIDEAWDAPAIPEDGVTGIGAKKPWVFASCNLETVQDVIVDLLPV